MPYSPQEFEEQAAELDRQQKLAAALRKQADETRTSEGSMVSGYYVRPNKYAAIPAILNNFMVTSQANKAAEAMKEYKRKAGQAAQEWQSALPQAVAGRAALPGPRAEGGSPELEEVPAQPLTTQRILKHTLEGMRIPGNEKAAELYNRAALADLNREDTQAEKAQQSHLTRLAAAEKQMEQAKARREEIQLKLAGNLTPEQRIMLKKMDDETKRYGIDKMAEAKVASAEARRTSGGGNVKPVPNTVIKTMSEAEEIARSLTEAAASFKPEYGGVEGMVNSVTGRWMPGAAQGSKDAADWWSEYEGSGMKSRHDLFGSALTGAEQASWKAAGIQKGMPGDVIQRNLRRRAEIVANHYKSLRQKYAVSGYPQILDAFEDHDFTVPEGTPPQAAPVRPTAPVRPAPQVTPAAPGARPLPPGFSRG